MGTIDRNDREDELCKKLRASLCIELVSARRDLVVAEGPEVREGVLRRLLRAHVADLLMEDLGGGELLKEVWEACRGDDDARAVRDELAFAIADVLFGRSCCLPSSAGGSCQRCGYPRAYAHPDDVDAAFHVDAVYVGGTAVEVSGDRDVPRGVVRIVHGERRGFAQFDYPIYQSQEVIHDEARG